ncbi:chromodomain Y-like protein isoform X2 [Ostrea edulis]|uniref:chromodomain Y-like protein isoform X2 n=1 Tax=Ostrea edulis TaxID=37623 RepID=UPI0024AE8DBC|nr:chromodomain Y-like protein isoform X2 [Ostrea edulis]
MADNRHYEVENILDKRIVNEQVHNLIRWKGFGSDWDTWEPVDNLVDCLKLVLDFEDKIEQSSELYSALEAASRRILTQSPKKDDMAKSKASEKTPSVDKSSAPKNNMLSKNKFCPKTKESPYKVSLSSVKGIKDEQIRKKLAREKGKLFIDMNEKTFTPSKAESVQSSKDQESSKTARTTCLEHAESQKSPKKDCSPKSPRKKENSVSPKKDTDDRMKTVHVNTESFGKNVTSEKKDLSLSKDGTEKPVKVHDKTMKNKSSPNEKKKIINTNSPEKFPKGDIKYKKSVKYAMKVKLKPTVKVKKESEKSVSKKKKDKEEVRKHVKKKATKDDKISAWSSGAKHKVHRTESGKAQKIVKSAKDRSEGGTPKNNKSNKRKAEADFCIIESSTSDTDDEPLFNMKVKKLKKSSSESPLSKKRDGKKISPKSKSGQNNNNHSGKVKSKQMTLHEVKRKLEVRVQPLGSSPKSKKIRLIDSKKDKEMAKVRPVSPSTSYTTVKPVTISGVGVVNLVVDGERATPLCGDVPGNQYLPSVIPVSPSSVSYKSLLDNMPLSLLAKKSGGKKKDSEDTSEDDQEKVERRISIRQSECAYRYKDIVVRKCQRYSQIWLNTHTKIKNVLNPQVIQEILQALNSAKYDDSSLILFSGLGNVFCNGVDLMFLLSGERRVVVRQMVDALRDFTKALITFPKPVIAVVNGPAVGLGMAMLPLCDIVYASDKATFYLPYSSLSQTPEGCASYTLPQSVGMAMANELLLGGRKVTAIEACQLGLVSQVFWPTSMMQEVIPKIQNIALNSAKALETTKLLLRSHQRTKLELTCESESNILLERWQSSECQKSIQAFLNKEEIYST